MAQYGLFVGVHSGKPEGANRSLPMSPCASRNSGVAQVNFVSAPVTRLLVSSTDPAQTEDLSQQVQARFAENLPYIPLMSPGGNFAYRPAAYDGWVYLKGTGIMTVWSFLPEGAQAIP